jgi:hypothetical protein
MTQIIKYGEGKSMDLMQRYVSEELTHFVGANLRKNIEDEKQLQETQYEILLKIIQEKCISYEPHLPRPLSKGLKYCMTREIGFDSRNRFSDN